MEENGKRERCLEKKKGKGRKRGRKGKMMKEEGEMKI